MCPSYSATGEHILEIGEHVLEIGEHVLEIGEHILEISQFVQQLQPEMELREQLQHMGALTALPGSVVVIGVTIMPSLRRT